MKLIPLSQGKFAMVDDEDYEELNKYKWSALRGNVAWYAVRTLHPGNRKVYMHKLLTGFAVTDHRDGDGLNNQRANLRDGSGNRNYLNGPSRGGTSSFKGVHLQSQTGRWRASIRHGAGQRRFLGCWATEQEAALAYDAAARELHGSFGTYNFPRPGERSALTGEILEGTPA